MKEMREYFFTLSIVNSLSYVECFEFLQTQDMQLFFI